MGEHIPRTQVGGDNPTSDVQGAAGHAKLDGGAGKVSHPTTSLFHEQCSRSMVLQGLFSR